MRLVMNFNFYLIIFYVLVFLVSVAIIIFLYTAQVAGVALFHVVSSFPPTATEIVFPLNTGSKVLEEAAASLDIETLNTPSKEIPQELPEEHSTLESLQKPPGEIREITPKVPEVTASNPMDGPIPRSAEGTVEGVPAVKDASLRGTLRRVWLNKAISIAKNESDTLGLNTAKTVNARINRVVNFKTSILLSDLNINTPNTKAPIFYATRLKGDGKVQFYDCTDPKCGLTAHTLETKWSGAENRLGAVAKFFIKQTLEISELQQPRCTAIPPELAKPIAKMFNVPETSIYVPSNHQPLTEEFMPESPFTSSTSPHNQFTR